jgi:hypothetical protein
VGIGYAKLFESLWDGSLRGKPDPILVFANLLTHAGPGGVVDIHFRKISDETGLDMNRVKEAILYLEAADPESRTPIEQGKRIIRLDSHRDWGWKIVNHSQYRALGGGDDSYREKSRLRTAKSRSVTLRNASVALPSASASASVSVPVPEEGAGRNQSMNFPSRAEVVLYADKIGLAEWRAIDWFNEMEGCGWLDHQHRPVLNWQAVLNRVKVKWEAEGRPAAPPGRASNGRSSAIGTVIALRDQRAALERQIEQHPANPQYAGYNPKCMELQKNDLRNKRRQLKEIDEKISSQQIG